MGIKTKHKNCGGEVKNMVCNKCGKTWTRWQLLFATDIKQVEEPDFNADRYRDRIRKGKDLR